MKCPYCGKRAYKIQPGIEEYYCDSCGMESYPEPKKAEEESQKKKEEGNKTP